MDIDNKSYDKNNKIELALASLMFFSPLIKSNLKNRSDISDNDKNFVHWFVKLWFFNIFLLILGITIEIISYFNAIAILDTIWTIILVILAAILLIESIFVISEKPIINTNPDDMAYLWNDIFTIFLNYIPLYNIYLWYKNHDFESENIWIKESILLWGLFVILLLLPTNKYILIWYLIVILMSMVSNMFHIDFGEWYKKFISNAFKKNPEEVRWYILWVIIYPFSWNSIAESIANQKWAYNLIFKLDHKQVLLELIILILLSIFGIYMWFRWWNYYLITGILAILWRYLIMLVKWKHMPHIPILKELTNVFFISKKQ